MEVCRNDRLELKIINNLFITESHWIYLRNFVHELLKRNHEVTCITNFSLDGPKPENYTEILIQEPYMAGTFLQAIHYHLPELYQSNFFTVAVSSIFGKILADNAMSDANVQRIIHQNNSHFDLIISDEIHIDSFLMFAHKFKAPIITICKLFQSNWTFLKSSQIKSKHFFSHVRCW